jgi:Ribbon-helix-helix protein, copG family
VAGWRPHPLAWGTVVAVAFFIAGVLVPWPRADMLLQDTGSEQPSAPAAQLSPREAIEGSPASPAMPSPPLRQERLQPVEPAPVPPESRAMLARQSPNQVSSSSPMTVTAMLPAELYERLQQEAQRRRMSLSAILREAVEAYAQSLK